MKTPMILYSLLLICGFAANTLAQGPIRFSNTSATPLLISDHTVTKVLGTASTAYFGIGPGAATIQLYAGTTSDSLTNVVFTLFFNTSPTITLTNYQGSINAVQGTFQSPSLFTFDFNPYEQSSMFLRFTADAVGGAGTGGFAGVPFHGESPTIEVFGPFDSSAPKILFSPIADSSHWDGLTLYPVPEPTSLALASVAVVLFLRRKTYR